MSPEGRGMLDATDYRMACRALALGVAMIAAFLGLRQWYERRGRTEPLTVEDEVYFRRQDVRRWAGVAVMLALALDVFGGSWVEPRVAGKGNPWFGVVWLVVLSLIVVMLGLAFLDLLATRKYARRHRRALFMNEIEEVRRRLYRAGVSSSGGDNPTARVDRPAEDD